MTLLHNPQSSQYVIQILKYFEVFLSCKAHKQRMKKRLQYNSDAYRSWKILNSHSSMGKGSVGIR